MPVYSQQIDVEFETPFAHGAGVVAEAKSQTRQQEDDHPGERAVALAAHDQHALVALRGGCRKRDGVDPRLSFWH